MQNEDEHLYITLLEGGHEYLDQVNDESLTDWLEYEEMQETIHYVLYHWTSLLSFTLWYDGLIISTEAITLSE